MNWSWTTASQNPFSMDPFGNGRGRNSAEDSDIPQARFKFGLEASDGVVSSLNEIEASQDYERALSVQEIEDTRHYNHVYEVVIEALGKDSMTSTTDDLSQGALEGYYHFLQCGVHGSESDGRVFAHEFLNDAAPAIGDSFGLLKPHNPRWPVTGQCCRFHLSLQSADHDVNTTLQVEPDDDNIDIFMMLD